jgi:hypothetical protein
MTAFLYSVNVDMTCHSNLEPRTCAYSNRYPGEIKNKRQQHVRYNVTVAMV